MNDKQLGFNFDTESLESAADLKQAEEERIELTKARETLKTKLSKLLAYCKGETSNDETNDEENNDEDEEGFEDGE